MKNYYEILQVASTAEDSVIRMAHKALIQKYHSDKMNDNADKAEADARVAEFNEARDVLLDPIKRKEYDHQLSEKDSDSDSQIQGEKNDEVITLSFGIPEISQIPIQNFSCGGVFSAPEINLSEAKNRVLGVLESVRKKLPKDISTESITDLTSLVFVPNWLLSGGASGKWRANGITVNRREVTCKKCSGKGTVGGGKNKQTCPSCKGSGIDTRRDERKTALEDITEVHITETLSNNASGIEFEFDLHKGLASFAITSSMKSKGYCLKPKYTEYEDAKKQLELLLDVALKKKVNGELRTVYDRVESFSVVSKEIYPDEVIGCWLYPAYICWYERKSVKEFVICDAVTGAVTLPESLKKKSSNFWKFVLFGILIYSLYSGIGSFFGHTPSNAEDLSETSKDVATESIAKVQLAKSKTTEQLPATKEILPKEKVLQDQNQTDTGNEQKSQDILEAHSLDQNNGQPNTLSTVTKPISDVSPSFDCSRAGIQAEKLICSSKELAEADVKLAEAFELRKKSVPLGIFKKQVKIDQADWIAHVRNACQDEACLLQAYKQRIEYLSESPKTDQACSIPGHC